MHLFYFIQYYLEKASAHMSNNPIKSITILRNQSVDNFS